MYKTGARKIALFGIGAIGSTPFEVDKCGGTNITSLCSAKINSAVQLFNERLKSLVTDLNTNLIDAKFTFIDYFGIGLSSAAASAGMYSFQHIKLTMDIQVYINPFVFQVLWFQMPHAVRRKVRPAYVSLSVPHAKTGPNIHFGMLSILLRFRMLL